MPFTPTAVLHPPRIRGEIEDGSVVSLCAAELAPMLRVRRYLLSCGQVELGFQLCTEVRHSASHSAKESA